MKDHSLTRSSPLSCSDAARCLRVRQACSPFCAKKKFGIKPIFVGLDHTKKRFLKIADNSELDFGTWYDSLGLSEGEHFPFTLEDSLIHPVLEEGGLLSVVVRTGTLLEAAEALEPGGGFSGSSGEPCDVLKRT